MEDNIFVYKALEYGENKSLKHGSIAELNTSFDTLLEKLKQINPPFSYELFPTVALNLKWRFDFLTNTAQDPFMIGHDLNYWNNQADMFLHFQKERWINDLLLEDKVEVMDNISVYNLIWPQNTDTENKFESSTQIAKLRVNQIVQYSEKEFNINPFYNKTVLDSGCGPGRYISAIKSFNPKNIMGLDSGSEIINNNNERFKDDDNVEFTEGNCTSLPFDNSDFDFVLSAGVLHHVEAPIEVTIREHARVLKNDGIFFVFIVGEQGLELTVWEFCRKLLSGVPTEYVYERFKHPVNHLRLQGFLDHGFSSYFHTDRKVFESLLDSNFKDVVRIPGVSGIDVTEELFKDDKFFTERFGSGNLRYICKK